MNEMDLDQMADDIVEQQKPQPKSNLDVNTLKSMGILDRSFTDYDKLLTPTPIDERESLLNPIIYQQPLELRKEMIFPYNDTNEKEISRSISEIKNREYQQSPEVKAYQKHYYNRPEVKERMYKNRREYIIQHPEYKEKISEYYYKNKNQAALSKQEKFEKSMDDFYPGWREGTEFTPEKLKELKEIKNDLRLKFSRQEYDKKPETKQHKKEYYKEYYQRPEVRKKMYDSNKRYIEKKKSMINELQEGINSL